MNNPTDPYEEFLLKKIPVDAGDGFEVAESEINPVLKPHQRAAVQWAIQGGRRALFEAFGLGKTAQQLEICRIVLKKLGSGRGLIVTPLGVRYEFARDAVELLGWEAPPRFVRWSAEVQTDEMFNGHHGIFLTNYESVRDGRLDVNLFDVVSLDEAACLRGFGGSKTFRQLMTLFELNQKIKYRFVATATPDPNSYEELLAYAAWLEIMDISAAKTKFFQRDSTKADKLTLRENKAEEFWHWVASWALFLQSPADLGFDSTGYDLPELEVIEHVVAVDHSTAPADKNGQGRLYRDSALGVSEAAREKRETLELRLAKAKEIVAADPDEHFLIWHDLEAERRALERSIPGIVSVYGSQKDEDKEAAIIGFADGQIQILGGKPVQLGSGCNFQRHCHREIFLGIGFKFKDFIQAVMRVYRFLQTEQVRVDVIYAESERRVWENLKAKWDKHKDTVARMSRMIREYGLSTEALKAKMSRSLGINRQEAGGRNFTLVNNDSVREMRNAEHYPDNSVHLILTSIPFSTQYEYSTKYEDMGCNEDNEQFFEQMDFLTPHLLRALAPGRLAVVHVKDRVTPGGLNKLGFQTLYRFSDKTCDHFEKHGFAFIGRKTIVTDVVRENNQTYRLGWTEQCKDGTKMGIGVPEYLLIFRKPPTDTSNAYADAPVVKNKDSYSRSRWQIDAHGFARANGDRLLSKEELLTLPHHLLFKWFKQYSLLNTYNHEEHVKVAEVLETCRQCEHIHTGQSGRCTCGCRGSGRLPTTFMLFQPQSWHPDVWSDVTRMLTLNTTQYAKGRDMHLCLGRGSLVLTRERGYIPIEDIKVGEYALTHKARWRRILAVRKTGICRAIRLYAQGVPGLVLTPDHQVWARKSDWARKRDGAQRVKAQWVNADQMMGGYVNFKLPEVDGESKGDLLSWWIVGRWLADGHWEKRGSAIISCGEHKWEYLKAKLGKRAGGSYRTCQTSRQVRLLDPDGALKSILRRCGKGAANKRLPAEAYTLPREYASALLDGYLSGDGYWLERDQDWVATSVSKPLLLGIAVLVHRVHGTVASIFAGRGARQSVIEGRSVNCLQEWIMTFNLKASRRSLPFILDDGAWKRVRRIEDAGQVETWNLRVEDDESYTADGCIVKNCPMPLDICNRVINQMSAEGETVLDPFGGLMSVPYCALKLKRKAIGVELNPDYFKDGFDYCRAVEQQLDMPTLFDLLGDSEEQDPVANEDLIDALIDEEAKTVAATD